MRCGAVRFCRWQRLGRRVDPLGLGLSRLLARIRGMDHFGADIEIVVDDRELASEVPGWLGRREGLSIRISRLASADYSIRGVIGVERKTAVDFAKSLIDGRLFTQISALRHAYERPLLLLERFCPDGEIGGVSRHALSGALISLTTIFGVPVLFSSGPENTAELIAAAERQLVRSAGISYVRPGYRPKGWRRRALYILQPSERRSRTGASAARAIRECRRRARCRRKGPGKHPRHRSRSRAKHPSRPGRGARPRERRRPGRAADRR